MRETPERLYAVVVTETLSHTVYVRASSKSEARNKARASRNWADDKQDFTEAAPVRVALGPVRVLSVAASVSPEATDA